MSKILIIQTEKEIDLKLILLLVERLGLSYQQTDTQYVDEPRLEKESESHENLLLEGLGLEENLTPMSYENLPDALQDFSTVYQPDYQTAKAYFGVWEQDEESLEELLDMLTP
ncbi:MAG: hypothetical protein NW226_26645 [Microscillaceae bacterium]|nr:hypothetical protein [Microscillaceae bacterium]